MTQGLDRLAAGSSSIFGWGFILTLTIYCFSPRPLRQEARDRRRGRRPRAVGLAHRPDPGHGRQRHRPGQLPALPGQGRGQRRRRLHDPLLRAPCSSSASR
ncbi:MAG: hypothetical protein M0C28_01660 [Candidatus Moduliflexus flocculans]|nr:hypothetical protein [Candidatus Moduliflexus flocculans]